ncbi:MAG TPA: hydrogenase maturation protease [Gaiellaceae bacterium]|jgi:hydrogenase maturation protease|nr:hydrogenase maturation protease [Gaiellaceae bacterium]
MNTVVIGVGNTYRGDDAAGLAAARELSELVPEGVLVLTTEQEPSRLLDAWAGANVAILVDAASSGDAPGAVKRFDASVDPIPAGVFRSSTHAFGVGDAIEMARALGTLPERVVVYAIEAERFELGAPLSPRAAVGVERVVEAVLEDIKEEQCTSAPS